MKHLIIVFMASICILQTLCSKDVYAIDLNVPKYNQDNFNSQYHSDNDCAPVAVGMIIGYWAQSGYPNLMVNSLNLPNTSLGDYSQNEANIKDMVHVFCDYLDWDDDDVLPHYGTPPYDLSHKTRLGISELNQYYQFAVSQKYYNDNITDRSAFYNDVKTKIDAGIPILFYTLPKLKYWGDIVKADGPYIFNENTNVAHYAVITGYTGRMIHLNWGMPGKLTVYIDADDLGYPGINGNTMFALRSIQPENDLSIGLYSDGWHLEYSNINGEYSSTYNTPSQPFVDAYIEAGGEAVFGLPWDNGGTIYVHAYPSETSSEALYIQDLLFTDEQSNVFWTLLVLNNELRKVFPLIGQILDFWWDNSGYNTYGPPVEAAHNEVDNNNYAIVVQQFQSGMYIGSCDTTNFVGVYTYSNGIYTSIPTAMLIKDLVAMKTLPNYLGSGQDALVCLGTHTISGKPVTTIINPLDNSVLKNIVFLGLNAAPKFITVLNDLNNNGAIDIRVVSVDSSVEYRDSETGEVINL